MPLAVIFSLCSLRRARLQIFLSAVLLNPAFPVVFLPKARSYFFFHISAGGGGGVEGKKKKKFVLAHA